MMYFHRVSSRYRRIYYDTCEQDDLDKNVLKYYLGDRIVLYIRCNNVASIEAALVHDATISTKLKYINLDV